MSKERLEEIKRQLEESNSYDDNPYGYWYKTIKWLIDTVENQQAEIDTLSMAHDDMHRLIDRDKHFLIKSNIALNNKIKELEDARAADIEELGYVDERLLEAEYKNKRYREALEFYADEKNYKHNSSMGHIIYSMTMYDKGKKARKALEGEKND